MVQNGEKKIREDSVLGLSNRKDDILFYREGERPDGAGCVVLCCFHTGGIKSHS